MIRQLAAGATRESNASLGQLLAAKTRISMRSGVTRWAFDRTGDPADIDQREHSEPVDTAIFEIVQTIQCMLVRRISQLEVSHSDCDITVSGTVTSYHARQLAEQGAKSVACQCKQRKFVSKICVVKDGASAARHSIR